MANYKEAHGVADLLSQFDFNIISEGPGDFSTQHRKYTCEFSKPGIESFTTTYQCNPRFDGQPTATDVFTEVSKPGSGIEEVIAIRTGQRREEARSDEGRVTLKGEAQASRAASEKLAEGRDTGSPAREDHSIV